MATLNDLGRNSAAITYNQTAGADMWPTFSLVDQWIRNDTLTGYATASGTTVTGVGTTFTTQVRAGDTYMIAGQMRTVASTPVSDTSMTVTAAFSPAINTPSAMKRINTTYYAGGTITGTATNTVRDFTTGTVAVTNGSVTVTGSGTFFFSDATNSVTLASIAGTVAVDIYGNLTGTSTSFQTSISGGIPGANALQPGDSLAITTGGNIYYVNVISVQSDTSAIVTPPPIAISAGATVQKCTNGVAGRTIVINGRSRIISSITNNTTLTLTVAMDFTDSNLKYKVLPRGTVTTATAVTVGATNVSSTGTTFTIPSTTGSTIPPGSAVVITAGTGQLATGTYITSVSPAAGQTSFTVNIAPTVALSLATISVIPPTVTANNAGFLWDLVDSDPVYLGDDSRQFNFNKTLTGVSSSSTTITVTSTVGLAAGMNVVVTSGTGSITAGSTIVNVASATTFVLSTTPSVALSGATIQVYSNSTAVVTDSNLYTGVGAVTFHSTYTAAPFRKDNTFFTGVGSTWTSDLRVNDDLIINGTECSVLQILSDTSMRVSFDYPSYFVNGVFSNPAAGGTVATIGSVAGSGPYTATITGLTSAYGIGVGSTITATTVSSGALASGTTVTSIVPSTNGTVSINITSAATPTAGTINNLSTTGTAIYKKFKIHGYVLEGTREGLNTGTPTTMFGKFSTQTSTVLNSNTQAGSNSITVVSGTNFATYEFIKIQGAGGPPVALTGYAGQIGSSPSYAIASGTTLLGTGTLFTQQLHVGAEICVDGQYLTVTAIASDTSLTVQQTIAATQGPIPIYRTTPLYTYITGGSGTTWTIGTPIKNATISTTRASTNPPAVYVASHGVDFLEFVYSAPNTSATATNTLFNTSLDRKYFGFRFFPLHQGQGTGTSGNATTTAGSSYSLPVYERWYAPWGQSNGVGINLADQSGGTILNVTQSTTTLTVTSTLIGSAAVNAMYQGAVVAGAGSTSIAIANSFITAGAGTSFTATSQTLTATSFVIQGLGVPPSPLVSATVPPTNTDIVGMTQQQGGFIYLFAQPTYFAIQHKSASNALSNFLGCIEFERAQPEDTGTGLGTTSGITFTALSGAAPVTGTPGIAPWPTYGYVNGLRFGTGASPIATSPVSNAQPTHGCVIAVPRTRESTGDLTGANAHIYSAFTITTGRFGHIWEVTGLGGVLSPGAITTSSLATTAVSAGVASGYGLPVPMMNHVVPVYTNVYNSKRFMFSPVVVLGTAYDPDIRGRLYGLKILPSNLGTLMDTVSILVDNNSFYSATGTATDHWVLTTAAQTYKVSYLASATQTVRSLEDTTTPTAGTVTAFTNNFRWALPA